MPKWLKIVLIILAVSVVICGGVVGACTIFVKGKAEEFTHDAEAAKKFGETHNGKECLDEALGKTKSCGDLKSMSGIACLTNVTIFFQSCMESTKDKQALCAAADYKPKDKELLDTWVKRICEEKGMKGHEGCQGVVSQVQTHCNFDFVGEGGDMNAPPTDEPPTDEPPAEEKPTE